MGADHGDARPHAAWGNGEEGGVAPSRRSAQWSRSALFWLVCTAAAGAARASITCPTPLTPQEAFQCSASAADELKFTAPSRWYLLTPGTVASTLTAQYPLSWIKKDARCCRHCVWSTGYPRIDPLVLASDRTQTNSSMHMDCNQFATDFTALDSSGDSRLTFAEMEPYLSIGVNSFLVKNQRLNTETAFRISDFNRDGYISKEEFLVLRHFWAPVHLSQVGPLPASEAVKLEDGPLGGLFIDGNLVEVFMTNVVNTILEQFEVSKTWACGCTGGVICPADCPWNSGSARESNSQEMNKILRTIDLDGSSRVSIEEHYFSEFADRDGNGVVSRAEYYVSLYPTTLDDGSADTAAIGYHFQKHDLNKDGVVTFLERKFSLADRTEDGLLTETEWVDADLPNFFGPFDGHKTLSTGVVDQLRYNYYSVLHECALQGVRTYQVTINETPLASFCTIVARAQNAGPWIDNTDLAVSTRRAADAPPAGPASVLAALELRERGEAAYAAAALEALDRVGPHRRAAAAGDSFLRSMFEEVVTRLRWRAEVVNVPKSAPHSVLDLLPPPITGEDYFNLNVGLFAGWQGPISDEYMCSRSFAPDLDGFVVVVLSNRPEVSLTEAVFRMVASSVFCNFSCFLFIALILIGHIYWLLERGENSEQFDPAYAQGVLDGAWFCIVTMSTVGYGDKAPATGPGKGLTVFWMLFGIINFGLFTGEISNQVGILQAQGRIEGVADLPTFPTGILNSTKGLGLDKEYLFVAKECADVKACLEMLRTRQVPALLMPQVDVLTYFAEARLATEICGNPFRIAGDPVLVDEYPSAKLCTYRRSVYAGQYIVEGVNAMLDKLDADGTTDVFKDALMAKVTETGEGDGCVPASDLELALVIPSAVIVVLYWALIFYINRRKTNLTGKLMREMFKTSNRSPEQIALEFGLRWKEKAHRNSLIRARGGKPKVPPPQHAASLDDRLLIFLKRVRLLSSGQSNDLARCSADADAVSHVHSLANEALFATIFVLLGLLAGVFVSIWYLNNALPKYLVLNTS